MYVSTPDGPAELGAYAYSRLCSPFTSRRYSTVNRQSRANSSFFVCGTPHQNQPPVISCQGRKMTGIGASAAPLSRDGPRRLPRKAASLSSDALNCSWRTPPGSTVVTADVVSHALPPVSGLFTCQLIVIT